jgi:hypothetical protein
MASLLIAAELQKSQQIGMLKRMGAVVSLLNRYGSRTAST